MRNSLTLMLIVTAVLGICQTKENSIHRWMNHHLNEVSEGDYQQIIEVLTQYLEHPIDLNRIGYASSLPFIIPDALLHCIVSYREKNGDLLSVYELTQLPCLSYSEAVDLLPFVTIAPKNAMPSLRRTQQHYAMLTIQYAAPLPIHRNTFQGTMIRRGLRYRYTSKSIVWGLTTESDIGEAGMMGPQRIPDHTAAYIQYRSKGWIKHILLGNYSVGFGQGLTINTRPSRGQFATPVSNKQILQGSAVNGSMSEGNSLFGGSILLGINPWELEVGLSRSAIDASLDANGNITTLYEQNGYHRTASEQRKKRVVPANQVFANLQYKSARGTVGLIATHRNLSKTMGLSMEVHHRYRFTGNRYSRIGMHYQYFFNNGNVYGESSLSEGRYASTVVGAMLFFSPRLSLGLSAHYYHPAFIPYQTSVTSSNRVATNSQGYTVDWAYRLTQKIRLNATVSSYRKPWITSTCYSLSEGQDYGLQAQYSPTKTTQLTIRIRGKTREKNVQTAAIPRTVMHQNIQTRYHVSHAISKQFALRFRIENNHMLLPKNGRGSVLYGDFIYTFRRLPISGSVRFSQSAINHYNQRIYAYEQVALYNYPLYNYYFNGQRYYFLLKAKTKRIKFWFKYGCTYAHHTVTALQDAPSFGSGLTTVQGSTKNTFTLQAKIDL